MSDTYNIIFNSRGSNAINSTKLYAVQYTVNWDAMLNRKYKRYKCNFTFRSEGTASTSTAIAYINMSFGTNTNIFDGTSRSDIIGCINILNTISRYFYLSTTNDNPSFTMGYPNQNLITLNINTFSGAALIDMTNYVLILNMVGIPDDE